MNEIIDLYVIFFGVFIVQTSCFQLFENSLFYKEVIVVYLKKTEPI